MEPAQFGIARKPMLALAVVATMILLVVTVSSPIVEAATFHIYKTTVSPIAVTPSSNASATDNGLNGYNHQICSSGSWTKWISISIPGHHLHTFQSTMCTGMGFDHGHDNSWSQCASLTGGTWYAQCLYWH
ncbi:MAG: hypothetical protein M0R74_10000 [Dehalococcoidia bacterium]|nr:hypothetical protein [Dehalococcoidia bacterium]